MFMNIYPMTSGAPLVWGFKITHKKSKMTDKNDMIQCYPLKAYGDVMLWTPPGHSNWAQLVKPLQKRAAHCFADYSGCGNSRKLVNSSKCPKTLVCHDMKGGYLNDRYVDGHNDLQDYKFVNWPCIDAFVYFSHEFITIPPLSWINAGHAHGVKVLGTIITEGDGWASQWEALSESRNLLEKFALNMSKICKFYGFDGYLLNTEIKLKVTIVRNAFLKFINALYKHLKAINSEKLLIWYDAMNYDGELSWQNTLNDKNRPFFDACDGIYLNYCWTEDCLVEALKNAGDRKFDVYVGMDVFGRGCYGGGGFSTCKPFELIRKYDLSAAIFAPGWVHEKCEKNENPDTRDLKFWHLLSKYLFSHGPCVMPFETSFCRGYGQQKARNGWLMNCEPWFNMSEMNHQPNLLVGFELDGNDGENNDCCFKYYVEESYSGGGCLLFTQNSNIDEHIDWFLVCDFSTDPDAYRIIIEVLTRPVRPYKSYEMDLVVSTGIFKDEETKEQFHYYPVKQNRDEMKAGWFKSSFKLDVGNDHILRLGFKLTGARNPILIGNLRVYEDFTL